MSLIARHHTSLDGLQSTATFSQCGLYRYWLRRSWADGPMALLLAMNPSTADERDNDPTIERFVRRVMRWNAQGGIRVNDRVLQFGSAGVVNVFAVRETDSTKLPSLIHAGIDIVGPENDRIILERCQVAGFILCGWGKPGGLMNRGGQVAAKLRAAGIPLHALAINADGTPKHPLYVGYDTMPVLL